MTARTVDESHRATTQLEFVFDLTTIVAAVAVVAAQVGHRVAEQPAAAGPGPLLQVFSPSLWAWMNFTSSLVLRQR